MNEIKRLTEGVSAFLQYEYCCMRGNLFSESYLATCVGGILQSLHGGRQAQVIAGYQHPALAGQMTGGGRRPELDFVVSAYDDSLPNQRARSEASPSRKTRDVSLLLTAVETKWAGSSHCTTANVIWDLLRLEMLVAENANLNAVLLIAGHLKDMQELREKLKLESILSFESGSRSVSLLPKDAVKMKLLAKLFLDESIQGMTFPRTLQVATSTTALEVKNASHMSVIAWQVRPVAHRLTFAPSDVRSYQL